MGGGWVMYTPTHTPQICTSEWTMSCILAILLFLILLLGKQEEGGWRSYYCVGPRVRRTLMPSMRGRKRNCDVVGWDVCARETPSAWCSWLTRLRYLICLMAEMQLTQDAQIELFKLWIDQSIFLKKKCRLISVFWFRNVWCIWYLNNTSPMVWNSRVLESPYQLGSHGPWAKSGRVCIVGVLQALWLLYPALLVSQKP